MARGTDSEGLWKRWVGAQRRKQGHVGKTIIGVPQDWSSAWPSAKAALFWIQFWYTMLTEDENRWKLCGRGKRLASGEDTQGLRKLNSVPIPLRKQLHLLLGSVSEGIPGWSEWGKGVITENVRVLVLWGVNHSYLEQSFLCRPPESRDKTCKKYFWCNQFYSDQRGSGPIRNNETQVVSLQAKKNTFHLSWRP